MRISDWSSDVCSSDLSQCLNRFGRRNASRRRGEGRNLHVKRRCPDRLAVLQGLPSFGRVEDKGDAAVLDPVDDMGSALCNLVHLFHSNTCVGEIARRTARSDDGEAQPGNLASGRQNGWFVAVLHRDEDVTRLRSEEHTSELQSLMRISYAVFCLKKKNIKNNKSIINYHILQQM